jgi:hypothetical protein
MIAVIAALAVALIYERIVAGCSQTSISAYYYTPVELVFVGGLLALCVGMVALWGRNAIEDAFLNLAGLFAPVVAFVPTTRVNRCNLGVGGEPQDNAPPEVLDGAHGAINNNMFTFAVVVALGLVLMGILRYNSIVTIPKQSKSPKEAESRKASDKLPRPRTGAGAYVLSYVLALAALAGGLIWFFGVGRDSFYAHAHVVAAVALFVCVIIVVFAGYFERAKTN